MMATWRPETDDPIDERAVDIGEDLLRTHSQSYPGLEVDSDNNRKQ